MRRALIAISLCFLGVGLPAHVARAGGGGCAELTEGSGSVVEITYSCFTPTLLRIRPGRAVTFVNRDPYAHVIVGAGYAWASRGKMAEGEAVRATFEREGVYPFQCYLHPGMVGAVVVGDGGPPRGAIIVEAVDLTAPSPQVVISPSPVLRTTVRTIERGGPWAWAIGGAAGLALGGVAAAAWTRRRSRSA